MNSETLLALLIQARAQVPDAPDTPFLLQKNGQALRSLAHPGFPEAGYTIDSEMQTALGSLVQWGYLVQITQDQDTGYLVTPAALSYVAHRHDRPWDGTERRRRATRDELWGSARGQIERRES
jgi:hypothetical protein